MSEYLLVIVSFLFLFCLRMQDRHHRKERQDLLNRLMSRDIVQYKTMTQEGDKPKPERTTNPLKAQIKKKYGEMD